jgi:dihydropteroate synthase
MPIPTLEHRPLVMAILNVTPDSFSDGGRWFDRDRAVERAEEMIAEGADIVDVGGESTRPGAEPVSVDEELRRVVPVVEALAGKVRLSVDTTKEEVAAAAVQAGASLINDVSASLWEVAARHGVGWVAMHRKGSPATMQHDPQYEDVVAEVAALLCERAVAGSRVGARWSEWRGHPASGASPVNGGTDSGVSWPANATSSRPPGPMGCPVMCSSTVMAWGPLCRRSDHSR